MINLIHGDCMEYMATLKDNEFDLAVVDPPYGIKINVSMGRRKGENPSQFKKFAGKDKQSPQIEYFEELIRVSKNQIIWGANHFISKMPWDSKSWIVWDKKFSNDMSFASCELAWTSFDKTIKKYTQSTKNPKRIHPTQKPIQLYQWIFDKYAQKGWRILDTHLGSGSSAIAAHDCGLEFVGIELDGDYFKAAKERLETHQRQLTLPW